MGKISSYPAMTALQGPELILGDQSGATGTTTPTAVAAYMAGLTTTPVIASYARTAAEIAVGVTPTNYAYEPGNAMRYGFVGDNVTDDTAALQTTFNVCQQGLVARIPFTGTGEYKISGPLYFDGAGGIVMEGAPTARLMLNGSGYTGLNIATKAPTVITKLIVAVDGTPATGAINGIAVGSPSTVGINLQVSNVEYLFAQYCAGFGIQINKCWDCHFDSCHANYCGSSTEYAFQINNGDDTTNQSTWSKVQVEAATEKAVFIDQILECAIAQLHAERVNGTAGTPTHVLGGAGVSYGPIYVLGGTNTLLQLTGTTCLFSGGINAGDSSVEFGTGNHEPFGYQTNYCFGVWADTLTELSSDVGSWVFDGLTCSGAFTFQSGTFTVYVKNSTLGPIVASHNNSECHFENCGITGPWTISGTPVARIRGGSITQFPGSQITLELDQVTVSQAFTTGGFQIIRARNCTFTGEVSFNGNSLDWRSDGCKFTAGAAYVAGSPGILFGPSDTFGVAIAAGYLTENPQTAASDVSYSIGDVWWNKGVAAGGVPGAICTTAGAPGTWTNMASLA